MGEFNRDLLRILACPMCKGTLKVVRDSLELECSRCEVRYPIKEGIPILMPPVLK